MHMYIRVQHCNGAVNVDLSEEAKITHETE
jgi:hypothetical protein